MSKKIKDSKNRWRNKIVGFRMSQEENELLNKKVSLCGCTKQDYIINRLLENEIKVVVNKKILFRLCDRLDKLTEAINNIDFKNKNNDLIFDELKFIFCMLDKIKDTEQLL